MWNSVRVAEWAVLGLVIYLYGSFLVCWGIDRRWHWAIGPRLEAVFPPWYWAKYHYAAEYAERQHELDEWLRQHYGD